MKKKKDSFSNQHLLYVKKIKRETIIVWVFRLLILTLIFGVWELFARLNIIDSFISSSPSKIVVTIKTLFPDKGVST